MADMMSFRVPQRTRRQMEQLATRYHSMTAVVVAAVDRMYAQEVTTMTDQIVHSIEEATAIADGDLWDQFCGDMTPAEVLASYNGPEDMAIHTTGWTATPEIADNIERRLWNYALESLADDDLIAARGGTFTWREDAYGAWVWCLSGVNGDGNAWETDDYEADNEEAAREAAADYLREYLRADA